MYCIMFSAFRLTSVRAQLLCNCISNRIQKFLKIKKKIILEFLVSLDCIKQSKKSNHSTLNSAFRNFPNYLKNQICYLKMKVFRPSILKRKPYLFLSFQCSQNTTYSIYKYHKLGISFNFHPSNIIIWYFEKYWKMKIQLSLSHKFKRAKIKPMSYPFIKHF